MASFSEFLFGKTPKMKQMQNFTPQQTDFLNNILSQLSQTGGNDQAIQWLSSLFSDDEDAFADFERPAMEQFEQQVIPHILERFRGGDTRNSSGLQQTLAQAGRGLSSDLAANRAQQRMGGINALQNFNQIGLNKQTTPYQTSGTKGLFDYAADIGGQAARGYFGGL